MENINKILSSMGKNTLHLHTPDINKYSLQIPFLAQGKIGVYVTTDIKEAEKELKNLDMKISIIKPEELSKIDIKEEEEEWRVVVDAIIAGMEFEKRLKKFGCPILYTYDITKLDSDILKNLIATHDKLIFTSSSSTIMSSPSLEKLDINTLEKFVKNNLSTVALALILNKPMCGKEIMKALHKNFNVFISPGSLYPLLKDLEQKGLLKYEYEIKNKVYKVSNKSKIREILKEKIQTNSFISKFLERYA